ncbi:MAG: uncharacterized protein JWP35_40 [Caulobacter sp.]|nr:uncharacterized protein [Caulobacter sp.]
MPTSSNGVAATLERGSLARLMRARSVAIVGASNSNPWSMLVASTLKALAFPGPVHLINKRGSPALGRETMASCTAIGEPVDAAFIVVPAEGVGDALRDMAEAGIRQGVLVTSGFAETGAEGAAEQARVFALARELGLTLLGPNSVGFANFVDRVGLGALPLRLPVTVGGVGVVSQSGATCGQMVRFAQQQDIGLSYAIATGNEAMVDLADLVDFLAGDEATRAIAVFAETIRSPERFAEGALRALVAGKPLAVLKVGRGALSAEVAKAHTGALVGDDRVFDAVCRELGVIRVDSLELLLQTSQLLASTGRLNGKGFAVASISGGACEMTADLGEAAGVRFTRLAAPTLERLGAALPAFGHANNPLDVTGDAMRDPTLFERSLQTMGEDPDVGLLGCIFDLPIGDSDVSPVTKVMLENIARGLAAAPCPTVLIEQTLGNRGVAGAAVIKDLGLPVVIGGIDYAMRAVGHAMQWSRNAVRPVVPPAPPPAPHVGGRPVSERQVLDYLGSRGVPVISATVAATRDQAVAAARAVDGPVVLKILSPDIQHKTEAGGLALDLADDAAVAAAFDAIMASVALKVPGARIEGVVVSPMRRGGVELLVGVARDPSWGLVMALGLGGVWVELLNEAALGRLPVTPDQAGELIGQTRAGILLAGYRGAQAADLDAVRKAIAAIGDAALALGPDLMSLEVNPLWVSGGAVECLDALAIWKD